MNVALLLIDDGREDYLQRCSASIYEHLPFFQHLVHVDDTTHRLGFAGAIAEGWRRVIETGAEWVWHAESDFLYEVTVPLELMIGVLERRPYLAQMSLKRQPVNEDERAAGDILLVHPNAYTEVTDGSSTWIEQRRFFTTNPSVYRTDLCRQGWPQVEHSEGVFSHGLFATGGLRCGIWGALDDPPRVHHIGEHRAGHGY